MNGEMTHDKLCMLATAWLRRGRSKNGPACQVALTEPRISFLSGESPDAIGWRIGADYESGSTVVECKISRADFLADRVKPHRLAGGMGRWRYFMCPAGLLAPADIPPRWGLLEVADNKVRAVIGPAVSSASWDGSYEQRCSEYEHAHDSIRETLLLANILHRIGDAGKMNSRLRAAEGKAAHFEKNFAASRAREGELSIKLHRAQLRLIEIGEGVA